MKLTRSRRFPRGNDLIGACATHGLGDLHDHVIHGATIEFRAIGYAPHNHGQTNWYRASFRRGGGIQIKQLTHF